MNDYLKIAGLSIFVWVFTLLMGNYTLIETIGLNLFVIFVYMITPIIKKRKQK